MEFGKLSMGMKLALVGGAMALVAIFMPWYGFSFLNFNAMNAGPLAWGGCLLVVAAAAILLMKNMGKNEVKAGGFATEQVAFFAALAGFVLILWRYLSLNVSVMMGLWVALIGAGLAAYGAFTVMKDAGHDFKPQQPQQPMG